MILLLDLGNSKVKLGFWGDKEFGFLGTTNYDGSIKPLVEQAIKKIPDYFHRAVGVSVTTAGNQHLIEQTVKDFLGLSVEWLSPVGEACGVVNGYDNPCQLGADRWAALIAARELAPNGACILDVGTAITVDGLDEKGVHLGGVIFPGRDALLAAMCSSVAGVNIENQCEIAKLPAFNTKDAVVGGVSYGITEAVKGLCERMVAICPQGSRRLVTGGGGRAMIAALSGDSWEYREGLVMEGVARMARGLPS